MIQGLFNVVSSVLFIVLLGLVMWWSRRGERHWTSRDGLRCICHMRISGDGLDHPWREVRLLVFPSKSTIAITAKGRRGKPFRGTWSLLGTPHTSLISDVAHDQQTFAVCKQSDSEQTAIVRINASSTTASIMRNCSPKIS